MSNSMDSVIADIQRFEIRLAKEDRGCCAQAELGGLPLEEVAGRIEARDPARRIFSSVKEEEFRGLCGKGVGGLCAFRGDDIQKGLDRYAKAIAAADGFPKLLVLAKILEEAVIRSPLGSFWRPAIARLAEPLDTAAMELSRKLLAIGCLKAVHGRAPDGRKKALAGDVLAGALFHDASGSNYRILGTLQEMETNLAIATIASYAITGKGATASAAYDYLIALFNQEGRPASEAEGELTNAAMVLSERGGRGAMPPCLATGFADLFCVGRIELPHPWYHAKPDVGGRPIPKLVEGGIHLSALASLGAMKSPQALALSITGLVQLAVPYVGQKTWDGSIDGVPGVRRALPRIADSLAQAMVRNGIANPFDLTGFLLSHPKYLELGQMDDARLARISPALFEIVSQSVAAGVEDFPIPGTAMLGLKRLVSEGGGSEGEIARSLAMTRFCARAHSGVLGHEDPELVGKRREFLRRIAAGDDLAGVKALLPPARGPGFKQNK
jgi:hypothetical protein